MGDRAHPDDQEIGDRPSLDHVWRDGDWRLELTPDWEGLINDLRGTEVFSRVYGAAASTIEANTAYTLLMDTLTKTHNLTDLEFAIGALRQAMTGTVGDFTPEQIVWINGKLSDRGFVLRLV